MTKAFKRRDLPTSMTAEEFKAAIKVRPTKLLRKGNSKLKKTNFQVFTLPAHHAMIVQDNELVQMKTCNSAGACAGFCFAQMGTYQFKNSMVAHARNLQYIIDAPFDFADQVISEVKNKRKVPTVRIHDAGDFFNKAYRDLWFNIARSCSEATFYIYTKEVHMFKDAQSKNLVPENFHIVFSLGGKQDHLVDLDNDRHSRVFESLEDCEAEGYVLSSNDDSNAANPQIKKLGLVFHAPAEGKKSFAQVESELVA